MQLVLIVTGLLNMVAFNDIAAKKYERFSRVFVVTELIVGGTQFTGKRYVHMKKRLK